MSSEQAINYRQLPGFSRAIDTVSEGKVKNLAVDALVGAIAIASAALARIIIEKFAGGIAPFILTFPAVMVATLARGGSAGAIAALGCQLLTIRYVFPHWLTNQHSGVGSDLANVLLSTLALAGTVWATASYRRAAALLRSKCQKQVETLSLLMTEMDHRTKNNFQIAAGLLAHQSIATLDLNLARELERAAHRLEAIASVYQDLSIQQTKKQSVDLTEHLGRITNLLREGATPSHVLLRFQGDQVELPVQTAIIVGLVVNEWVTNALKYAFDHGPGRIDVEVRTKGNTVEVVVRDDGTGVQGQSGHGGAVVAALAEAIDGTVSVDVRGGTRCALTFAARKAS